MASLVARWLEWREHPGSNIDWDRWFGRGTMTHAGVDVTEEGSLALPAVWACVNVLAQTIGMLPLITYARLPNGGKSRATEHPLYELLHLTPNPEQTSLEWREMMVGHLASWGNAFAEIEADRRGRVTALWPLLPNRMIEVKRENGRVRYKYRLEGGQEKVFADYQILHLRGLSGNGLVGYSPVRVTMQAIGLGLATEEFGARFFSNGARPGGIIQYPGQLSDAAYKRMQESWKEDYQGLSNAHRIKILEMGATFEKVGIPPEEAQFLQTREFQAEEVARIYRMPPHKIGLLNKATFSNIEHQSIEFVTDTIMPWLVRMEQRYTLDLLTTQERQRVFVEHLVSGLLRGDIKARYDAYAIGRSWGWLSANDVLRMENMDPIDGGDVYLQPLNMVPAGTAGGAPGGAPQKETKSAEQDQTARAWMAEATQRVARREAADLRRLLPVLQRGDRDEFNARVDRLYRELAPAAADVMRLPLRALGLTDDEVQDRAAGYVMRRRAAVDGALMDTGAEGSPAGAVEALIGGWEAASDG
jgi:HK97 family phage portal protein